MPGVEVEEAEGLFLNADADALPGKNFGGQDDVLTEGDVMLQAEKRSTRSRAVWCSL